VGYDVVECGHNYRMDELRAAMGLVQIERLAEWNDTRRLLAAEYRAAVAEHLPMAAVPFTAGHPTTGHLMPVLLPSGCDRRNVMAHMREARVQTSMHYPPIHQFDYYQRTFRPEPLRNTEQFAEAELTLPLHPQLSSVDVKRVVVSLRDAMLATAAR